MPRLLILCEYPTVLGGEQSMLATLSAVSAAGFQVVIAAPAEGTLAGTLRERGIEHIPWRTSDDAGSRFPLEELRSNLENIIRNVRPDLLHANSLSTARIAGPVAAQCSVKSIGHLRDIIKLTSQALDDLNSHRKLIAVSRATQDFHISQGLDATKCVVLHNGVDLREFHPRSPSGYLQRELNIPRTSPLVATIGQLGLRKGTDVALAAALQIAEQCPDAHWLIVGERTSSKSESREFEVHLRDVAAHPALGGRVHFLGTRHDIASLLPECQILVHTARQEPLGRVLLEAAACGLAIVATDVGGTSEVFPRDTSSVVLVPPDDPTAVASAVISLLCDQQLRASLARAARLRAESEFDIRTAAQNLIAQYQELLA